MSYLIQRASNSAGPWTDVTMHLASTTRSYTVTGLTRGVRYYFRIAAFKTAGSGPFGTTSATAR